MAEFRADLSQLPPGNYHISWSFVGVAGNDVDLPSVTVTIPMEIKPCSVTVRVSSNNSLLATGTTNFLPVSLDDLLLIQIRCKLRMLFEVTLPPKKLLPDSRDMIPLFADPLLDPLRDRPGPEGGWRTAERLEQLVAVLPDFGREVNDAVWALQRRSSILPTLVTPFVQSGMSRDDQDSRLRVVETSPRYALQSSTPRLVPLHQRTSAVELLSPATTVPQMGFLEEISIATEAVVASADQLQAEPQNMPAAEGAAVDKNLGTISSTTSLGSEAQTAFDASGATHSDLTGLPVGVTLAKEPSR